MKPVSFKLIFAVSAITALGGTAARAQSTLVPIPFATSVAGLAAGSGNTACPTTQDIPNNVGAHTGDGCLPTQATLTTVYGAFTDTAGNIYITENGTNADIRVIYRGGASLATMLTAANVNVTPALVPIPGRIYTLAGQAAATFTVKNASGKYSCNGTTTGASALDSGGNGCPATQAYIKPRGMYVDANGNVFVVNNSPGIELRVIYSGGAQVAALITAENPGVTPQVGYIYKLAGQSAGAYTGDGGLASAAAFDIPRDVVGDSNGNIYLSDGNSTTASGNNVRVIYGGLVAPPGIANPTLGFIYTFAGGAGCVEPGTTCTAGDTGDGGAATAATLNGPYTLFVDRFNNLFITEYLSGRLRVVYNSGTIGGITNPVVGAIYTYAGGGASTTENTAANQLLFGTTQTSGVDAGGNIYLEDGTTKRLWRFDATTAIGYIVAGRTSGTAPVAGVSCSGTGTTAPVSTDNYADGCPSVQAAISDTGRVSFDPQGNFYLGENGNAVVRRLSYNTQFPSANVAATSTEPLAFKAVTAVTLGTESIREQGTATEFADAGTDTCTATSALTAAQVCVFNVNFTSAHDGLRTSTFQLSSATATLATDYLSGLGIGSDIAIDPSTQVSAGTGLAPSGIAVDNAGNTYVADSKGNQVLRGSTSSTTLTAFVTGLKAPAGLAIDTPGNLYIADSGNNRVLMVTTGTTQTTTVLGTGLNAPQGVTVDAFNNVFVADTGNNRIVEIAPDGAQTTVAALTGLSAPEQLTFDSLGNLYVADTGNNRIVELPALGFQTTFALPTGTKPTGVAVDPSGTLYVADAATLQLLSFAPGATTGNTLLTGLVTPKALAADADANLYLADSGVASATYLRRSPANVQFPITNVNQTSTASLSVTNVGNATLNFPTTTLYNRTGSTAFTLAPATTNGCGSGVNYVAGAGCAFTASFSPTTKGAATANVTFNTNAGNTTTASANLTANAQQLTTTVTTIAVTSPTGTITYGQAVTLTATVAPTTNVGTPTGTVTFTVDNKAQAPLPYGTGTYTLTLNPTVGAHTVSVAFSGDGLYASSSATTTFTVAQAPTTTTLTVAAASANGVTSLTFTATAASATATGETGSVSFYAGTQLLGTIGLNTTTRTATYTTTALSFATNTFTAVYSGDNNFAGSTSATNTPGIDYVLSTASTTVTVPQSGIVNLSYGIAPIFSASGTLTASCSGLPANSLCRFTPNPITLNGTQTSVALQIYTNVSSTLAENNTPASFTHRDELFFAMFLPLGLLAFNRGRIRFAGLACFTAMLALLPLAGCGSGSPSATQSQGLVTPTGTYTVTVTFAGTAPLTTHTTVITLTVIPNTTTF